MDINKKIIILLGDGMADHPIESLQNKTPLEYAQTPHMDFIAQNGICGMVRTVPQGMQPGSDTANLSVFGYDPVESYTGRAPLEALNIGIDLGEKDVAFRCNIVNIESDTMKDFTAGHIDSRLSEVIMRELAAHNTEPNIEYYPGVSYRNIIIWRDFPYSEVTQSTPPHDITGKTVTGYLPKGDGAENLIKLMDQAASVIRNSEKIQKAKEQYSGNPSTIWLWGGGNKPHVRTLKELYGLHGYTISAVDLIHGIGRAAGLEPVTVEGATGYIDTNYEGKVEALRSRLDDANFIFLHVEAPDESGHQGSIENKLKAIEDFDSKIVGPVLKEMEKYDDYTILVMPDHPTPIKLMTHTDEPVPFAIYKSKNWAGDSSGMQAEKYSEVSAQKTGLYVPEGHMLLKIISQGKVYSGK